ncbi:1-aminocyclopropane-1-carboxylate deaminase/D-cysteine desulfhydrase [Azotobacter armeniacus]
MLDICWSPQAPLQPLALDWLAAAGVQVGVLRLDLIDPLISGNKWYKLVPHLAAATRQGARGLISLGGPHSNHLHALAAAGQRFAFPTVGLLRGEPCETPTVSDLQTFGMRLHWLGYSGYRARHREGFWNAWRDCYPHLHPVAEGGGSLIGAQGCRVLREMLLSRLEALGWSDYHGWWLAAGSGTTLAGLVLAEAGAHPVHGALAVPASHGVAPQVRAILAAAGVADTGYRLLDASRAGFARLDAELARFILDSEREGGIPLDPVYTGKALLALREEVERGGIPHGSRLVFVHTGGLQGRRALAERLQMLGSRD